MGGMFNREGIYLYLWLIHVDIWKKSTEYLESNYPPIKNKLKTKTKILIYKYFQIKKFFKKNPGPVGPHSLLQSSSAWFAHDPKGQFTEHNEPANLSYTLELSKGIFNMP